MDAREQFVIAWQQSGSVREVAERMRMGTHAVNCRATKFRKRGVPLKPMPTGRPGGGHAKSNDWPKLILLAIRNAPPCKCAQCRQTVSGPDLDTYDPELCSRCAERNDAEMVAEAEREGYCEEAA